jgi:uncharacterized protein
MIHQFRQNGFNIVLDVYSGAGHVVDDLVFDILEALQPPLPEYCPPYVLDKLKERYTAEQIASAYAEIMELYRSGQLFSEDDYGRFESLMSVSPEKAACLHIAHDCNLRCEYCFASTGEYAGTGSDERRGGKGGHRFFCSFIQPAAQPGGGFFRRRAADEFFRRPSDRPIPRSKEKEYGKVFRFTITTNACFWTMIKSTLSTGNVQCGAFSGRKARCQRPGPQAPRR